MAENTLSRSSTLDSITARAIFTPVALAFAAAALVALCAQVSVPLPFTPVPLNLAPGAVLFLGLALGPRLAFASLCLYLLEGALGLPVFSPHAPAGLAHLLGATGGYLFGYPIGAAVAGLIYRRSSRSFVRALAGAAVGSLLILVAGACWLKLLTGMPLGLVSTQAVLPFLPGDALKVCAAAGAAGLTETFRNRLR